MDVIPVKEVTGSIKINKKNIRISQKDLIEMSKHLPLKNAAEKLNVSRTTLKRYCRIFGIGRWHWRTYKAYDIPMVVVNDYDFWGIYNDLRLYEDFNIEQYIN